MTTPMVLSPSPESAPAGLPPGARPGSPEAFIASIGEGSADAFKLLPGMLLRYLLPRLPVMAFSFIVIWIIHFLLLVVVNDGFNPDTAVSPFINVTGNILSSFLLYGFSSALFWSLLFSMFRMGPFGAVMHFVTRPVAMLRMAGRNGKTGAGAFVTGISLAVLVNAVLAGLSVISFGIIPRINSPANLCLAGALTFLGLSRPGYLLAMLLSTIWNRSLARMATRGFKGSVVNLRLLQTVLAGLAPGFFIAALLLINFDFFDNQLVTKALFLSQSAFAFLVGAALLILGYLLLKGKLGAASAPPPAIAGLLIIGLATTAALALLELLFTRKAYADDGGWREASSNPVEWITSDGAIEAGGRGVGPAGGAGIGPLTPPMEGEEEEEKFWSLRASGSPGRLDAKPGATFTVAATVSTNDPAGDPAAVAATISFTPGGDAAGWFTCTDESQEGATKTATFVMAEVDLAKEPPGARSLTIFAAATAPTGGISGSAGCAVMVGGEPKLVWEFDSGKNAIRPDGKDQTVLKAKVVLIAADGNETPCDEGTESIGFTKENEWLDTSEAVMWDATWKAITIQASDPAGPDAHNQPPSPVTLTVTGKLGEQSLAATAPLELLAKPELDVDLRPDTVSLIQGDPTPVSFKAFITNPGEEKWGWELKFDREDFATADYAETETPGVVTVTVTPPTNTTEGSTGAADRTKLHIFATQSGLDEPLERIISVVLAREGLTVLPAGMDPDGAYVLKCDMETKKEVQFVVFTKGEDGKLAPDAKLVKNLWFEDSAEGDDLRNLLSVAKPEIKSGRALDGGGAVWTFRSQDFIPGEKGETYRIPMLARVIGKEDKPEFETSFTLGLKVVAPDIGSDDWKTELANCHKAIKFVPEPFKTRLAERIDLQGQTLGHEGLKLFRKKIWSIAQELILAEGAEGYRSNERWEDWGLFLAENIKWGTDLVFTAAAGAAFGPVGVIGAPILKGLIEKILVVASERGFGEVDDWFWECVTEIEQTLDWESVMQQGALVVGGMVTDPAVLEKILGDSPKQKAAAWAIYVGFQFASNMARGMSMCEAVKQTMRTVRDRLVVQFLMGKFKVAALPQTLKDAAARMTGTPPRMTPADMIAIQSDPQMLRSLKTAPPNIQQGFLRTYNQTLVAPHDAQLVAHVRSLPEYQGRVIRVESFSTPGKGGSAIGADRDFRVTMQNPDGTWREVPAGLWRGRSNEIVGNLSGGKTHQQLNWRATDRFDIEASPDYATQNGQISNIVRVTRGQSTLRDPQQFGNMWQQKMSGVEPGHTVPPLENVAQAQKAASTLAAVRNGYQQQGYQISNLTPQMQKGIEIVKGANVTATGNYQTVDQALKNAGFRGGFSDFSNKLSSQFGALGMARRG